MKIKLLPLLERKFDRKFREGARAAHEQIVKALTKIRETNRYKDFFRERSSRNAGEVFLVNLTQVFPDRKIFKNLELRFIDKDKPSTQGSGYWYNGSKNNPQYRITLNIDPFKFKELFDEKFLDKRDMFIHEFIHHLDMLRYSRDYVPRSGEAVYGDDLENYYNTPEEFNAFYQQTALQIESTLNSMKPEDKAKELESFENFMAFVEQDHGELISFFKGKYDKKFKKRLADLYSELEEDNKEQL